MPTLLAQGPQSGISRPTPAIAGLQTARQELLTINKPDEPTLTAKIAPGTAQKSTPRKMKFGGELLGKKLGKSLTEKDIAGFRL